MDRVYLADSFVLGLEVDESLLCFTMNAVLEEGHPRFTGLPKPVSNTPTSSFAGACLERSGGTKDRTSITRSPMPLESRTTATSTPSGQKATWSTLRATGGRLPFAGLPCGCRKCHPGLLIREFSYLVAPTTMWRIESNSVENGSAGSRITPG